jgi:glycosyltransferase involved in cell wall biosynthesis
MRFLALTNLFPSPYLPHKAPFNRYQFRLLGARHPVAVIAPIAWTDEFRARRRGQSPLVPGRRVELDGLVVDHPRFYFPPKILQRTYGRLFEASVAATFRRRVDEFHPDLVFASWAYPDGWAAVQLARRAGLRVVIQVLGSDVLLLTKHPRRAQLTFDALREADGVITVSRDLARRVIEEGVSPNKVRVIYGGVDPALYHPGAKAAARLRVGLDPGGDPVILFVGNLLPVKGIDVLIDACAILAAAGWRFRCRIIGHGPLAESLQTRIDRVGLRDRVTLLGAKPQTELPDWYRASDVFALPSHSEGVPNVLREASACAIPCVATRVGGIPEISDCGTIRLIPPANPATLAGAICEVLAGGGQPRPFPPPRTWSESIDDLEQFLAGVMARDPARHPALVGRLS